METHIDIIKIHIWTVAPSYRSLVWYQRLPARIVREGVSIADGLDTRWVLPSDTGKDGICIPVLADERLTPLASLGDTEAGALAVYSGRWGIEPMEALNTTSNFSSRPESTTGYGFVLNDDQKKHAYRKACCSE
ncbi:hypothetical protein DFH09DRAFT_1101066 [Mycena vulgaris]|nr:hypothetical protein DFH09DRAFT_1101066 [Mycena vulgaris]